MQLNYPIVIIIVLISAAIIFILARKNQKDEKEFEKDANSTEATPENHRDDEMR